MIKVKEKDGGLKVSVKGTTSQLACQLECLITDLLDEFIIDERLFYEVAANAIDEHRKHKEVSKNGHT